MKKHSDNIKPGSKVSENTSQTLDSAKDMQSASLDAGNLTDKPRHPGGRPTDYTQELADTMCAELSQGRSLRSVCQDDGMPSGKTFFSWLRTYPEFLKQYEAAKQESADAMAEDTLFIADTPLEGEEITIKPDGSKEVKKSDMLGHRRLQVDTRKWLMSKMKPKKYGDKLDMTTNGKDLPTPILGGASAVRTDDSSTEASETP